MTDIQKTDKSGLTWRVISDMTGFSLADIALVRATVAQGAPMDELAVFLHSCRQLKLDPLLRQAYWIRRGDPPRGALQVGIDGFRAIAEQSGLYAGAEAIEYRGQLEWKYRKDTVIAPELARATVWKVVAGHKSAFVGEAHWIEFCPTKENEQFMWARMPRHMLGKVAEAQALRRAFPAQLGAIEMAEDQPTGVEEVRPRPDQATLAKRHAEIYDNAYDLPELSDGAAQDALSARPGGRVTDDERAAAWQRNRELTNQAAELKIKARTLKASATLAELTEANTSLEGEINRALDGQLAEVDDE